ncbi:GTP-binding protein [Sticta canariensis]|nr:GTP-binding protein [Sticta canariensis]
MPKLRISELRTLIAKHISPSALAYHWETPVPTSLQLRRAEEFFLTHRPKLLYSTPTFRTVQQSTLPEVAFLGRSNVGKSSLLNGIMRKELCHTSKKPGRTTYMNFIAVGGQDENGNPGRMLVLDMPGYGKGSRPEWGAEVMKYLVGRRQLRRAFVLIDASHGLKKSDETLLHSLREYAISHQVILSKVDRILFDHDEGMRPLHEEKFQSNIAELRRICEEVRAKIQPRESDGPEALGEIVSCSADKRLDKKAKLGLNQVRWAVIAAAGLGEKKRRLLPSEMC